MTAFVAPARPRLGRSRQLAPFARYGTQLRFVIRRDRVRGPVWVAGFVGLVTVSVASVVGLYSTPADLSSYATVAQANAAIKALTGPGWGLDHPTQGAVAMNEMSLYTYLAMALMCIFLLVRHTRAEEETDRADLVRAAPVGRYATLAAAATWVFVLALVISVGNVVALVAFGLPTVGSLAYGAATLVTACVFIGVAAMTAQVASGARAALSMASGILALSFLIRAVGDVGNGWMIWLSPLGIAQAIRPYADERWWVLAPLLVITTALLLATLVLTGRRDLGAGILTQRPGPAVGAPSLATPFALAERLQRVSLAGWLLGIAILGFFFGLVADQAEALADNQAIADILDQAGRGTITESFLATIMLTNALVASGFTVGAVLRLRSEELALRAVPVLATPVDRRRWWWSHVVVSAVGSVILMIAGGLATGVGYLVETGDAGEILPLVAAGSVMAVGLGVLAMFTGALVGLTVRWSILAWSAVAWVAVAGLLAQTLSLPQWMRDLSPFEHLPAMPAAPFELLPVAVLVAVAAAFAAIGLFGIRRRDIG